jgi:NAD(P)-dependent dehydrogenase (short-subunit alcohol dehydrogenase family)
MLTMVEGPRLSKVSNLPQLGLDSPVRLSEADVTGPYGPFKSNQENPSPMNRLQGKVALITGGTTGIGAATAKLFMAEGATVIVTGQNPSTVNRLRDDLPGVEAVIANQQDTEGSRGLVENIAKRHGRIDVLFVNAGIAHFAPLEAVDEKFFDLQFGVNVRGAYFIVKHAAAIMPSGGSIILTGSTAGSSGAAAMSVYSATKAALRSFGRTLAAELAPRNIRVNTISPGPIETPIFGKSGLSQGQIDDFISNIKSRVPLGRVGRPEEVAVTALYLAADATFVTGEEIFVGGGLVNI